MDPHVVKDRTPILNGFLHQYSLRDIYNSDEMGLYYNLLPDRTLTVKDDP
jgi:hypothetical protein